MKKRFFILIILLFFILFLTILFKKPLIIEKYIPSNPVFYLNIDNLDKHLLTIKKTNFYKAFLKFIEKDTHLSSKKTQIERFISQIGKKFIFGVYLTDPSKIKFLGAIEIKNPVLTKTLLYNSSTSYKYKGVNIRKIKFNSSQEKSIDFLFFKNYLLFSNSQKIIEKCIDFYKNKSLKTSFYYSDFFKKQISKKHKPDFLGYFKIPTKITKRPACVSHFPAVESMYFELHKAEKDIFFLKRISVINPLLRSFIKKTESFSSLEFIPENVTYLDIELFNFETLKPFLQMFTFRKKSKKIQTFLKKLLNNLENEFGILFLKLTRSNKMPFIFQGCIFFQVKDKEKLKNILNNILNSGVEKEKNTFKVESNPFSYKGFIIYKLKVTPNINKPENFFEVNYFFIKNFLIIGVGDIYSEIIKTFKKTNPNILNNFYFKKFFKKGDKTGLIYINYQNLRRTVKTFFKNLKELAPFLEENLLKNLEIFFTTPLKISQFSFDQKYFEDGKIISVNYFNLKDLPYKDWQNFFKAAKETFLLLEKYKKFILRSKLRKS